MSRFGKPPSHNPIMARRRVDLCVLAFFLMAMLPAAAAAAEGEAGDSSASPTLAADPDRPGPRLPPVGRSIFDELFEAEPLAADRDDAAYRIPFPFERLLAEIEARIAPARVKTALIPIGRSLQRFAADPEYFASPRLVVAVDAAPTTGGDKPFLKDRFYLGYQPAARTIEVISYNEAAGRFEFQVVEDYAADQPAWVEYADRAICVTCHQGHAPIFPEALWGETNANPGIADRMIELGETFHGVPVRQGVDGPDAFDLATDRANRIATVQKLWDQGCGSGEAGRQRRAAVLYAALSFRLGGARQAWWPPSGDALRADLHERLTTLWPDGLWMPDSDLPNRNPLTELSSGKEPAAIIEPSGPFDPALPRAPVLVWQAPKDEAESFGGLARDVATFFSARDIGRLDARLAEQAGQAAQVHRGTCRTRHIDLGGGLGELRIFCESDEITLDGYVRRRGASILDGRLRSLNLGDHPTIALLRVAGGTVETETQGERLRIALREGATGLSARLATGESLSALSLTIKRSGAAEAEVAVHDDLSPLRDALRRLAEASLDDHPLGPGPLRRRALLAALETALSGS